MIETINTKNTISWISETIADARRSEDAFIREFSKITFSKWTPICFLAVGAYIFTARSLSKYQKLSNRLPAPRVHHHPRYVPVVKPLLKEGVQPKVPNDNLENDTRFLQLGENQDFLVPRYSKHEIDNFREYSAYLKDLNDAHANCVRIQINGQRKTKVILNAFLAVMCAIAAGIIANKF